MQIVGGVRYQYFVPVYLCRDDASATSELNDLLYSSINDRLKSNHVDPNLVCNNMSLSS